MSRLYVYAAIALALAGAFGYVWHLHGKAGERDAYKAQAERLQADYQALKVEYAHQTKIAKEASDGYQKDLQRLDEASHHSSIGVVRLCKPSPAVPAESRAAPGSDATSPPNDSQTVGADIGPQLLDYGIACEANMLQLTRLQEWVMAR